MIDVDTRLSEVTDLLKHTTGRAESDSRLIQNLRARDLGHAAHILKEFQLQGPDIQLTTGDKPIDTFHARKNPYDFIELHPDVAEPHTAERLRFYYLAKLDAYDERPQHLFGHVHYFSLDAIGRALRDGGSLTTVE
jgi:hypothetical protein